MSQKNTSAAHRPRIRKGDSVVVITGADKGKTGRVLAVYPRESRILVEGVRVAKRSYRKGANPSLPQGGIHEKEMPVHISNVMLAHPKTGAPARLGVRYADDTAYSYSLELTTMAKEKATDSAKGKDKG
ncbi:MAG: 50S ribosomal protein L24, partial [bacterium]|nr:50S ribosomal protein L24 [Candidatus Kapabacteria bacterium]